MFHLRCVIVERPIRSFICPDHDGAQLLALPLDEACWELPKAVRWNRCLRLLRKMWSVRFGKNIRFQFNTSVKERWQG